MSPTSPSRRNRPRPHPRRGGWIPFGLTGQLLLAAALVPGAAFAPEIGDAVASGVSGAVADGIASVWDAAERWADSNLHFEQSPRRLRRDLAGR